MDDEHANVIDECFDDDDDDCLFTLTSHTNYGDERPMDDEQANVVDECFDDDDDDDDYYCPFTLASHASYGDECLMDDDDDDGPFQDDARSNWDDDNTPFQGDSQSNVNDVGDPLPSHESRPTRHTQPHPSTLSGRIELSDSQMPLPPSRVPSFELPARSGLSPDIISRLTLPDLFHNPEFTRVYTTLDDLRFTFINLADQLLEQRRINDELRVRVLNHSRERVLEWRMRIPA
ncbi:hypothetical protein BJY52DRAFT_57960 [Lactarius psammicola]|nr:hypothetical protein BJY52DRAFT_57960 [Lactarius psammicola]